MLSGHSSCPLKCDLSSSFRGKAENKTLFIHVLTFMASSAGKTERGLVRGGQDLSAAGLKNKKHWHSFTAPGFFLPLGEVLQRLEAEGQLFIDPVAAELLLKGPMQCHRCRAPLANMPTLKQHIQGCPAPYNAADVL